MPGPLCYSLEQMLLFLPFHQCCRCLQPRLFSPFDGGHVLFQTHPLRDPADPQILCQWLALTLGTSPGSLADHAGPWQPGCGTRLRYPFSSLQLCCAPPPAHQTAVLLEQLEPFSSCLFLLVGRTSYLGLLSLFFLHLPPMVPICEVGFL